jgi:CMP-N-acetylneuraminic acid synthetase
MPSIIAVVPAKSFSNRISNKNQRLMVGRPLYMRAVDNCVESGAFERVYLSSDAVFDTELKATLHARQMPLCGDVPACAVTQEVLKDLYPEVWRRPEWTCLVQPTSPCLRASSLKRAGDLCSEDVDAVIATRPGERSPCGAFYFLRTYVAARTVRIVDELKVLDDGGRVAWYPLPSDECIDVDCHWDWRIAELILKERANEA